ncbi:hypothetical protein HK102_013732, partial [Quaeritorhiza haematococci]
MGRRNARYNAKARASNTAKAHPNPRSSASTGASHENSQAIQSHGTVDMVVDRVMDDETPEYVGSSSANPLILLPGQQGPGASNDSTKDVAAKLAEGKINSKKKKRLEKFIEKQLKKEERKMLLEKLSKDRFESSELLRSSKTIGRTKLTMRERLRQTLMEERSGLAATDKDSRLFVEKEILSDMEDADYDDGSDSDDEVELAEESKANSVPEKKKVEHEEENKSQSSSEAKPASAQAPAPEQKTPSLLAQAFGSALKRSSSPANASSTAQPAQPPVVVVVADESAGPQPADQPAPVAQPPRVIFGGALKRKNPPTATETEKKSAGDAGDGESKSKKRKKAKKQKEGKEGSGDAQQSVFYSSSDDEDFDDDEEEEEETTKTDTPSTTKANSRRVGKKWASNVVEGESIPESSTSQPNPSLASYPPKGA